VQLRTYSRTGRLRRADSQKSAVSFFERSRAFANDASGGSLEESTIALHSYSALDQCTSGAKLPANVVSEAPVGTDLEQYSFFGRNCLTSATPAC